MRLTAVVAAIGLLLLTMLTPTLAAPYLPLGSRVKRDASPVARARASPSPSPSPRPYGEARFREPRIPTRRKVQARAEDEQESLIAPMEASALLCPQSMTVCPITPAAPSKLSEWLRDGFECVDTTEDLTSCGGCGMFDAKYDCTAIDGARSVSCVIGTCRVNSCKPGYTLGLDNSTCIRTE